MKSIVACIFVLVSLLGLSQSLSFMMVKTDPYCFDIRFKGVQEVKVQYIVSGLNEDQIKVQVGSLSH